MAITTSAGKVGIFCAVFVLLAMKLCGHTAFAQPATATSQPSVRQASFSESASRAKPRAVQFGGRLPRVGDQVQQTLALEMRLAMSARQGDQLVRKSRMATRSKQRRLVTTTDVVAGRTMEVTVRYLEAARRMAASDTLAAGESDGKVLETAPDIAQAVQGNLYYCRRESGEAGRLVITDEQGKVPPPEECEIVSQNMETVGRPNPLAEFLAGRTVATGETLALPKEAADRLFNLGRQFGEVTRFDLTLRDTIIVDGETCAVFSAQIEAASWDSSQMALQVEGQLVVQIDSCRAARTELSGPIAISELRGSHSNAQQVIGTGQLSMRIACAYRNEAR
jgi:hypothetical protein